MGEKERQLVVDRFEELIPEHDRRPSNFDEIVAECIALILAIADGVATNEQFARYSELMNAFTLGSEVLDWSERYRKEALDAIAVYE